MLETPFSRNTREKYLVLLNIVNYRLTMHSEKVSSADNQQERLRIEGWLVGFTDGEGAFTVSIIKNHTSKIGWQVFPEFIVTQGAKSKDVLFLFQEYFKCGHVYLNRRFDNHNENIYRYCVRSLKDLRSAIIPFYANNPLKTHKAEDFKLFCLIMDMISVGDHLSIQGIRDIAHIAMGMNRKAKPKFLESSQTIRQTPPPAGKI